ncbi:hypothetical protein CRM22_006839 [Opisthorchis felineus]|uniref:F-box domain-containing protein n=1 Tax=Opisthorchis felineus TaxID=147828 RepID=A0A4S2LJ09_OPIFE|nr:hypothetical protein CRM22_006839 [Opisthorchis felineus]
MNDICESDPINQTQTDCNIPSEQWHQCSAVDAIQSYHAQVSIPSQSKRARLNTADCEGYSLLAIEEKLPNPPSEQNGVDLLSLPKQDPMTDIDDKYATQRELVLPRDFTEILPLELSLRILSYLALYDILECAKVSHRWNRIACDPLLWFRLCQNSGLVSDAVRTMEMDRLPHPHVEVQNSFSPSYSTSSKSSGKPCYELGVPHTPSADILSVDWKMVFRRSVESQCNWRHGTHLKPIVLSAHHNHVITCLEVYNDWAITGSDDSSICIWSITRGSLLISLFGHIGGVWSLTVLAPNSGGYEQRPLLVSGSCDRTARVWLLDGLRWPCIATLFGHQSTVRCLAGQRAESSCFTHGQKEWSCFHQSSEARTIDIDNQAIGLPSTTEESTVADEESGSLRLVATGSRDTTVRLWNALTGRCLRLFEGHRGAIRCVQFNEWKVVSGSYDCTVRIWSIITGTCLNVLIGHENRVYTLVFDGVHVITASLDTTIRVWSASTGELRHTFRGHRSLTSGMAHDTYSRVLVSSNADETLRIWDLQTGHCLHILAGLYKHHSAVTCVQLTRNFVVSSSDDGTVKLWDRVSGAYVRDLIRLDGAGRGGVVWRIVASEDKLVCAAGSRNGMETTKLIILHFDRACAKPPDPHRTCSKRSKPAPPPRLSEVLAARPAYTNEAVQTNV